MAVAVEDPAAPLTVPGTATELSRRAGAVEDPPPPIPEPTTPVPPRIALFHDFAKDQKDGLVVNHRSRYADGVKIEGNVQVTGVFTQASSIALKENISELSGEEAMATLQGLNAVKFHYKADRQQQHIGFHRRRRTRYIGHPRARPPQPDGHHCRADQSRAGTLRGSQELEGAESRGARMTTLRDIALFLKESREPISLRVLGEQTGFFDISRVLGDYLTSIPTTDPDKDVVASVCPNRLALPIGALAIPYCSNKSPEKRDTTVRRAVVVIHGNGRNAPGYYRSMLDAANGAGRLAETIIIAPHFLIENDVNTSHCLPLPSPRPQV